MPDDTPYVVRTTNHTARANAPQHRSQAARRPRHYTNNPGPQDRLAAAAGPSRPRINNANIQWEPTFRKGAEKIWEEALGKQVRPPRNPRQDMRDADQTGRLDGAEQGGAASEGGQRLALNFSGMLDGMSGDATVDMYGVPVSDGYQTHISGDLPKTSEGKVSAKCAGAYQQRSCLPRFTDSGGLYATFC